MVDLSLKEIINKLNKKLPKFPDGRINYSKSNLAIVITVFVKYKDKILILKRSRKVRTYKNKWNTVAGYLDELIPIRQKSLEELQEEIGISKKQISKIKISKPYKFNDKKIKKTWIVNPVLVEFIKKPKIKLDWEHTDYKWISPEEIKNFKTVPNFEKSLESVLK